MPIRDSSGAAVAMLGIDMVLDALDARMASLQRAFGVALVVVLLLSIAAGAVAHRIAAVRRGDRQQAAQGARARPKRNAAAAREREPRKGAVPRDDEPRDPHAHERHAGRRRPAAHHVAGSASRSAARHPAVSGGSLLRIINDILDFSKMEAERLELHAARRSNCARSLDELEHLLAPQARARNVSLRRSKSDPELPAGVKAIASGSRRCCSISATTPSSSRITAKCG